MALSGFTQRLILPIIILQYTAPAICYGPFKVPAVRAAERAATMTVTMDDCPDDITMTVFASATPTFPTTLSTYTTSIPASLCTGTTAICPCISGYACLAIGACEWGCVAIASSTATFTTLTSTNPAAVASSSSILISTTSTISASTSLFIMKSATSEAASAAVASYAAAATTPVPAYASADPETLRPCVPGTFLCTSATSFLTCDYNDGSDASAAADAYVYDYPRTVAAGMMCLPHLSPYSRATAAYAQQADTQAGFYRDDRYVRARPNGSCSDDGSFQCENGGQSFMVCDQGGWVDMGAVAAGTSCLMGIIVANP